MSILNKVPLESFDVSKFLEEEQEFLKGFLEQLEKIDSNKLTVKRKELIESLLKELPTEIDKIFPMKSPEDQIQALMSIGKILSRTFAKVNFDQIGLQNKWVLLKNGYLGRFVEEDYEIAIILYLISAIYQTLALKNVQTSSQYRYFFISSLSALKGAISFMDRLSPNEEHYAYPFYQSLQLRKLEVDAEITKSEAFIARKKGDFETASKLFAGAASYRFSMMSFDLPYKSDNQIKIYASTELGMACFYIAVGLSNVNELEKSYYYLLKAKSYFENATKLSENDTELLEAANKRLDLVNPYIDRIKDSLENINKNVEEIPDPQPIMIHSEPDPLFFPGDKTEGHVKICSSCYKKIDWVDKCPECGEKIIPLE
ncbi:MAG: hypothetical protein FK730_12405 [Asgard group archaeon]|nr:hypothetical protein [Asgard group archaeon]